MNLFDSHTHLCDRAFIEDWPSALERARKAGIVSLIDVGYDRDTIERSQIIADRSPLVYTAAGFHPHEAGRISDEDIGWLGQKLRHPRCVGFGEIGLDFVKNYSDKQSQHTLLDKMLELSVQVDKPIILHSRGAESEVLLKVRQRGIRKAVFHCYTGPASVAREIIKAGYHLSFAGYVTFPKGWPDWVADIPADRILIETDAPYLSPVPYRGRRNEPAHIEFTCRRMAEGMGRDPREFAALTTENARTFFGIPASDSGETHSI